MRPPIDMTGEVYGRLTVLRRVPAKRADRSSWWLCRCACGTEKAVSRKNLRGGNTRSCKCLLVETNIRRKRA